jgi:hypothetical protein
VFRLVPPLSQTNPINNTVQGQYSETNVMHILFNLLRIKGLYLLILRRCCTNGAWSIACVVYQLAAPVTKCRLVLNRLRGRKYRP